MNINISVNEVLVQEALAVGNQETEQNVVETALREYIQRRQQTKILELFGTIDYDSDYDYKRQRQQS